MIQHIKNNPLSIEKIYDIILLIFIATISLILLDVFFGKYIKHPIDIGPISSLIGGIASITTATLAFNGYRIAKNWSKEKFRGHLFLECASFFETVRYIPLRAKLTIRDIEYLAIEVNKIKKQNPQEKIKELIITKNRNMLEYLLPWRQDEITSIAKWYSIKKNIKEDQHNYISKLIENYTDFLSLLREPLMYDYKTKSAILSPSLEDAYKKLLSPEYKDSRNLLAAISIEQFTSL